MSHIPDMDVHGPMVAVGWLHPKHPYPRGSAPPEFVARLSEFSRNCGHSFEALHWPVAAGFHACEFCTKPMASRVFGNDMASGVFGVSAGKRIYYCPQMIAHYVIEHGYLPPAKFIAAVMKLPIPGTAEYRAAVEPFTHLFEGRRSKTNARLIWHVVGLAFGLLVALAGLHWLIRVLYAI